jgi:PTH1 family peptidyl-tRNA hydrolase
MVNDMKLIVGLGNPGREYSETRHNVGFMTIDELAKRWEIVSWRSRHEALIGEYRIGDEQLILVKPQTFMNLSGNAVGALARWYKVKIEDIIVIHDDMDLPTGRLRLRTKGSSGGHRGIESLLMQLGQEEFARVRIGIGRPPQGWQVVDYVLAKFNAEESPLIEAVIKKAADAVEGIVKHGLNKAMNTFNR